MSNEHHLTESERAAALAGPMVTEHISLLVDGAERHAEQIRRAAYEDAGAMRRAALESARGLIERIEALERPLGELVLSLRAEIDRVAGELESGSAGVLESGNSVDGSAFSLPDDGTAFRPAPEEEPAPKEEPAPTTEAEPAPQPPETAEPVAAGPAERGRWRDRLRRRRGKHPFITSRGFCLVCRRAFKAGSEEKLRLSGWHVSDKGGLCPECQKEGWQTRGTFITIEGYCFVCQDAFRAGSEENLRQSGWVVNDDVGLCPGCQGEGWQLPAGARLPFRRALLAAPSVDG